MAPCEALVADLPGAQRNGGCAVIQWAQRGGRADAMDVLYDVTNLGLAFGTALTRTGCVIR